MKRTIEFGKYELSSFLIPTETTTSDYYCWISERVVPLDELAILRNADRERCVVAVCDVMIRAALKGLLLSDCHFHNFGLSISHGAAEHVVLLLDAGSRGLQQQAHAKAEVNRGMKQLWDWAAKEIDAPYETPQRIWQEKHSLQEAGPYIRELWAQRPLVTIENTDPWEVDQQVRAVTHNNFRNYLGTTEAKLINLVGRNVALPI